MYSRGRSGEDYTSKVLHCRFDGVELNLIEEGDALSVAGGRGLVEPSLASFRGLWYLTLRNDARGYVTTSRDGLHFAPLTPWKFDDDSELGTYNTQQHWLVHDQGLYLAYTRRGANNDQIPRNRAPLFLAQVDPESLRVLRSTEQVLIPERGVMLGNFGACAITPGESWVTDAEYLMSATPHPRGADGSVFAARVKWSLPNRLRSANSPTRIVVLGDSITKGVRTGVSAEETFAALLEKELRIQGLEIDVVNLGIGGERTDQALQRMARDVATLEPVLVTVMYGTNDSYVDQGRSASRLTANQFENNLRQMVLDLRRWGIQPVLMTEPRWGNKATLNGAGENPNLRLEPLMERTRKICRDQNLPLIDHYKIWSDAETAGIETGTWTTDQCHPNPEGHRRLADAMLPVLQSLLKASAGQ
jgi:lysophospholipase L1-like esterase